ncbi:hypothetical protein [Pseudacidovorax intermedius]|uniref:DUF1833 domain-containing protein n=1 Tax=Pseudacidovorax intermedius TaxID=433924 RepID=A0A147GQR8_9BURK|nr:hypothetical protein [Pseudacidovorax intermedius]KTT17969.1 hypothetical protein NS331_16565 [Pseudacidovorax intermedius]
MDRAEFWSTKSPLPVFEAVVFEHPAFDQTFYLVANQFEEVVLGGVAHIPTPMTVKPPDQTGDATAKLSIAFPRAVVGREFKRKLGLVRASGSREPIVVRYRVFLGETDAPKVTWNLFAADGQGITFSPDTVQVNATADNPMRRLAGPIYDPALFTGLQLV